MTNTWFISDTHFYHKNILQYEKEARPFESVEEMNEKIIDNWNKVVNHKDIVYHLGDFAFGKNNISIAVRLNGHKKLILGNHDIYDANLYLHYFEKVYGVFYWQRCVMTHIPVHPDTLSWNKILNIHGHLHSRTIKDRFCLNSELISDIDYFNVSCEQNNLTPIHADVIIDRVNDLILER